MVLIQCSSTSLLIKKYFYFIYLSIEQHKICIFFTNSKNSKFFHIPTLKKKTLLNYPHIDYYVTKNQHILSLCLDLMVVRHWSHGGETLTSWWWDIDLIVVRHWSHGGETLTSWWWDIDIVVRHWPHCGETLTSWLWDIDLMVLRHWPHGCETLTSLWWDIDLIVVRHWCHGS